MSDKVLGAPDTNNGWFKIARDWAVLFTRVPLTPVESRLVWCALLRTYGTLEKQNDGTWKARRSCSWTIYDFASETRTAEKRVRHAMRRLLSKDGKGLFLGAWPTATEPGTLEWNRNFHNWNMWDRRESDGPSRVVPLFLLENEDKSFDLESEPSPVEPQLPEPVTVADPAVPDEPPPAPVETPAAREVRMARAQPKTDSTDWWKNPAVSLPTYQTVLEFAKEAKSLAATKPVSDWDWHDWWKANIGYCADPQSPRRWMVIQEVIEECASNFATGDRRKIRDSGSEWHDSLCRFLWSSVLPAARASACVGSGKGKPYSLLCALARLRILVAMCDADDESDDFWVAKVTDQGKLAKYAPKMCEQAAVSADWQERESRRVHHWGSMG